MKSYEACCLFRAEDDKFSVSKEAVKSALETLGAQELKEEDMQVRTLAYPINKIHQGHYFLFVFSMDPAKAHDIEEEVKLIPDLIRIMVSRKDD